MTDDDSDPLPRVVTDAINLLFDGAKREGVDHRAAMLVTFSWLTQAARQTGLARADVLDAMEKVRRAFLAGCDQRTVN